MRLCIFTCLLFIVFPAYRVSSQVIKVELPERLFAFTFQEGKKDEVWVGLSDGNTLGGLGVYRNGSFSLESNKEGLPSGSYHVSTKLPDGSMMFSGNIVNETGRPLLVWISSMGIDTIQIPFELSNPHVNCIELINRKEIWIGTSSGLLTSNKGRWTWITSHDGLPDNSVTSIFQDFRGIVWVGTENGMAYLMDDTLYLPEKGSRIINAITTVFGDNRGYVWCGARYASEGISVYNGQVWDTFSGRHGLVDNSSSIFFQDLSGNMWVGSCYNRSRGGVSVFDGKQWIGYSFPDDLAKPCVDAIATDANGNVWMGGSLTHRKAKGISVYNGKEWLVTGGNSILPAERIITFFLDSKGNLWVSSFEGLFIVGREYSYFEKK